jgi:glycosyltransferase involved in cell wall biosynthesis
VTGVGAPEQTASAVLEILGSDELREQMAKSGVTRTEKFYRQSQVLSRYSELYKRHLST